MEAPVPTVTGWIARVTRTPLLGKLLVMDAALNVVAFLALHTTPPDLQEEVALLSLGVVLVLNLVLVGWALQPLQVLEETTWQVSQGDFGARARMPWIADRNLVRIGSTLNALLERIVSDRARVRSLAAQVVAAGDHERARIARELHDGTAQSLAALDMLLTATLGEVERPETRERLVAMQQIVGEALQEVRTLSHDVHPRVLDDLGLQAALASLVRRSRALTDAVVELQTSGLDEDLPREVASVAYRVVQEALHNALKHGEPTRVEVEVDAAEGRVRLRVHDDGVGFDAAGEAGGIGLFVMDERVGLVEGTLSIVSEPGSGTEVSAVLPVRP
ncbi:MAG: sensor histidine kinase [Myxococcales bacterium]|nr:sensor histidine kinase [Myxococcales bacterium]